MKIMLNIYPFNKVFREIWQIFKDTFFNKTPLMAASGRVCEETILVKILQFCLGINHRCFRKIHVKKNNE